MEYRISRIHQMTTEATPKNGRLAQTVKQTALLSKSIHCKLGNCEAVRCPLDNRR
jgi:hypothetical protein